MTTTSALPKVAAGTLNAIHIQAVPVGRLAPNHINIALEYAGVGSWDTSQRAGLDGAVKPRTILGVDGSGTIAAIGSSVEKFSVGVGTVRPDNGVGPKPHLNGHPGLAFDGEMSREAFDRLNAVIGSQTIPLRTEVFPLKDVVEAHRRIECGHVIGDRAAHQFMTITNRATAGADLDNISPSDFELDSCLGPQLQSRRLSSEGPRP